MKRLFYLLLLLQFYNFSFAQNKGAINDNKAFLSYIQQNNKTPVEYVKDKLKNYSALLIGEDHWSKDQMIFMVDLIAELKSDPKVQFDVLAFESGNSSDQKLADEFINSPVYREDLLIKILQNAADTYGWPYLEAVNILKAVWENNQKYTPDNKTKILLLDPPYLLSYLDGDSFTYTISRDQSQAELIQKEIINGKKIIFYGGLAHTKSQIRGIYTKDKKMFNNYFSAGRILKMLYPSLVFTVELWGPLMGRNGYINSSDDFTWKPLYDGSVDVAFSKNQNKPIGFDIANSPLAEIEIGAFYHYTSTSEYDPKTGNPYNPKEKLENQIDGIIFFKPIKEYTGSSVYEKFFDEEFLKRIEKRTKGEVKTRKQLYKLIKEEHPILSESLDSLILKEQ